MNGIISQDIQALTNQKQDFSKARCLLEAYLQTPGLSPKELTWAHKSLRSHPLLAHPRPG
jgi:hypothetical protein